MENHKYALQKYNGTSSRYNCPSCGKKSFTRYFDTITGEIIDTTVGRCDREDKCGYHFTPRDYFSQNGNFTGKPVLNLTDKKKIKKTSIYFLTADYLKESLSNYSGNNFIRYLTSRFGKEETEKVTAHYFIGTSDLWPGSTIFWQIDYQDRIRTGKIMLYNPASGRRVKEPVNCIGWVHKDLKIPDYELSQCLFGEHLLRNNSKPVAIVESEKTAVIASLYLPQLIWLATGGKNNLTEKKCSVLKDRHVVLFPDLNGYEKWCKKAIELSKLFPTSCFKVSDLLETIANEEARNNGYDIADYLVRFDWQEFRTELKESDTIPNTLNNNL
jgi:hypothetical protein